MERKLNFMQIGNLLVILGLAIITIILATSPKNYTVNEDMVSPTEITTSASSTETTSAIMTDSTTTTTTYTTTERNTVALDPQVDDWVCEEVVYFFAGVLDAEAVDDYDSAMAVAQVVFKRAEVGYRSAKNYNCQQDRIMAVLTESGQFSTVSKRSSKGNCCVVWKGTTYYTNGNPSELQIEVARDCLTGVWEDIIGTRLEFRSEGYFEANKNGELSYAETPINIGDNVFFGGGIKLPKWYTD